MRFSARVYAAVDKYFAHWQDVSRQTFEASFNAHLEESMGSDCRLDYATSLRRLAASLNNAHTFFFDGWQQKHYGQPLGFSLQRLERDWVVVSSQRTQLAVGSVVKAVDGQAIEDFYAQRAPLIAASSERGRRIRLSSSAVLWPLAFELTLGQGASVAIDRNEAAAEPVARGLPGALAGVCHCVKSFADPQHERAAVEFFAANARCAALILDLRGNGGGSTPVRLIAALMSHWQWPLIAEREHRSGREAELSTATIRDDPHSLERFEQTRVALRFKQPVWKQATPLFTGRLIVLIDRGCASACENLLLALKQRPDTTLVGEATFGSSGQPHFTAIGTEMVFAVGARREYLSDGRSLEGVGIEPDVAVGLKAADLWVGHDAVMAAAVGLLEGVTGSVPVQL